MKLKFLFLLLIISTFCFSQQTKSALFLGNSYTQYNSLPQLVKNLAIAHGNNLLIDSYTPGGYTFQGHSTNTTSLNKIKAQAWDFVVLQEQSQIPSFPPSQVQTDCYPYAAILNDSILANNPCTEPLFYMTWGRKNGDASNCGFYPPICTYDGMQQRLTESYLELAEDNNASVAPVGVAWKQVRTLYPTINLYNPDESHPSLEGSYLAACVIYVSMFKQTVVGNTYISTLDSLTAYRLQTIASGTVLDSINLWYLLDNSLENNLAADTANCGINISLSLDGNYSALWNTGDTTLSIVCENSGNYVFELSNARSCSSIDSIQVTLNEISAIYIDVEACDSFVLNNITFYADTSFSETYLSPSGCDSTINYNIEFPPTAITITWENNFDSGNDTSYIYIDASVWDSLYVFDILNATEHINEDTISFVCYFEGNLFVWNSCGIDTIRLFNFCESIKELDNSWSIGPNPAFTSFLIANKLGAGFSYKMMDMFGRTIKDEAFKTNSFQEVFIETLSPSVYYLILYDKHGNALGKKTIQKQ